MQTCAVAQLEQPALAIDLLDAGVGPERTEQTDRGRSDRGVQAFKERLGLGDHGAEWNGMVRERERAEDTGGMTGRRTDSDGWREVEAERGKGTEAEAEAEREAVSKAFCRSEQLESKLETWDSAPNNHRMSKKYGPPRCTDRSSSVGVI